MMGRIACVLLTLAAAAAAQETEYTINLSRAMKAGDRYDMKISTRMETASVARVDGRIENEESARLQVEFEGVFEIRAVKNNEPTHVVCLVRRLVVTRDGKKSEPFAAGDRFEVKEEGSETRYSVADGELSEELEEALSMVIELGSSGPSEQQCFGPKAAVSLGDRWNGDAEAIAKDLLEAELVAKPANIRASAQLEAIETRWKVPCHRVLITMEATGLTFPEEDPDFVVAGSKMSAGWTTTQPLDTALTHAVMTGKATFEATMRSRDARDNTQFTTRLTSEMTIESVPLRK